MNRIASDQDIAAEAAPLSVRSLRSRAYRASSWVLVGHVLGQALRLLGNLVMTRLLAPDVFGIMAIATVVQIIISLLADIGLRQAIFQNRDGDSRSFLNTAWTLQALRGCWIWAVCAAVAVGLHFARVWGWAAVDSVYAAPDLPPVIAVASLSAIIGGLQSTKVFILNRNLDLKRVTLIDLFSLIGGLLLAALLGWATHSIWSFVASGLASSLVSTLLGHMWLPGPVNRFEWNHRALRELLSFGKWVFFSSLLGVLAMNGDRLLIGGWTDSTVLGFYSIALNFIMVFDGAASRLFSGVSLPALSEVARRDPAQVPHLYFRMRVPSDMAFVGIAGFLFATGQWIAGLLYDARYAPVGPMIQLLSFALLFNRYNLAHNVYMALGQPRYVTIISATKFVSLFSLVPGLFFLFGLPGAILGVAFHMFPTVLWVLWFNRRHGLNSYLLEVALLGMWPLGWLAGSAIFAL